MASAGPLQLALAAELRGHEQDVRSVAASPAGDVVTASRDASIRVWRRETDGARYEQTRTLVGHSHYVGAVTTMGPDGQVVSGSNDKHVIVWDGEGGSPSHILEGHSEVVACVAATEGGDVVSGSWDKTVRVWREGGAGACEVLSGHGQAVWAVLPLPDGAGIASASGDRTVRIWRDGACAVTLTGHTDVVRALALVPGVGLASASNDGTVRLWTLDGACIRTIHASDSFVYGVAVLPSGHLAACGEDRTLRIFSAADGACVQAIPHPAPVWAVAVLPSGDVATGCADAVARVFTAEPARRADADTAAAFEQQVAAQRIPATEIPGQVGGVDVAALPDESALGTPGAKEGQYKIVRSAAGTPTIYTWSVAEGSWKKLGDVVSDPHAEAGAAGGGGAAGGIGVSASGGRTHKGKQYDFVFDVDIAEGQPPLPLAYNRTDDPWTVAQAFLHEHNLPQSYLEQTASFIIQNAGPPPSTVRNVDPFTAGGAYVPPPPGGGGGAAGGAAAAARNADPFTAAGAYVAGSAPHPAVGAAGGGGGGGTEDGLTASRYRPGDASGGAGGAGAGVGAGGAGGPTFPQRSSLLFDALPKPDTVSAKLAELNSALRAAGDARALSEEQSAALAELARALGGAGTAAGQPPRAAVADAQLSALLSAALSWPPSSAFPALDLLRVAMAAPGVAARLAAATSSGAAPALTPRLLSLLGADAAAPPPTVVMALRALANMCALGELHGAVGEHAAAVLEAASEQLSAAPNAQARTAAATLLLNFSVFVRSSPASEEEAQAQILSAVAPALAAAASGGALGTAPAAELEALRRLLLAVGTLAHSAQGAGFVRQLVTDLGISESIAQLAAPGAAPGSAAAALGACAAQLKQLLG